MSSQPIISIQENAAAPKATVNLLPVRISHDGTFPHNPAHWSPAKKEDRSSVSYFRGRKIIGHVVTVPETHQGVVLESVNPDSENNDNDGIVEVANHGKELEGEMIVHSEFDKVVIWGQDAIALSADDPYARNMQEWASVAEKIHKV